jgi:hypothetical protein
MWWWTTMNVNTIRKQIAHLTLAREHHIERVKYHRELITSVHDDIKRLSAELDALDNVNVVDNETS